jgi:hypothetical protein
MKWLYQTLDIHNSAGLSAKIWLGRRQSEARKFGLPDWPIEDQRGCTSSGRSYRSPALKPA